MKLTHTVALAIAVFSLNAHAAPESCATKTVQATLNSIVGYDTELLNGGSIQPHCFAISQASDGLVNRINQRFALRRGNRISGRELCGLSLADTITLIQNRLGCR